VDAPTPEAEKVEAPEAPEKPSEATVRKGAKTDEEVHTGRGA
jgi:hypothetical protein